MIHCLINGMFTNSGTTMCIYTRTASNFTSSLLTAIDKLYQWVTLLKKTVQLQISGPVQQIDTVHLWIFQNTDVWFSMKHNTVQNIDELYTCTYSRTLNTIPVCNIDIHEYL